MLLPAEFPQVRAELATALSGYTDPRAQVTVIFTVNASPLLQVMPFALSNYEDVSTWLINYCLNSRWTLQPSLLECLLQWLVTSKGIGALHPVLLRAQAGVDPNPNVYSSRWVLATQPFFARQDLRPLAKNFIELNGSPVLQILGPGGSGRTYTREYFDFLGNQLPGIHIAPAKIEAADAPSCDLKWLGETLAGHMGITDPLPTPSGSAYAGALCRWVLKHAMAKGEKWIFVFDGFDQDRVIEDIVSFTNQLADSISMGEHRKRLRLVLIAYKKPLSVSSAIVLSENVPPSTAVGRQDLIDCLLELNAQRQAAHKAPIDVTEMGNIADQLLQQAPANGKERLMFIHEKLRQLPSMA